VNWCDTLAMHEVIKNFKTFGTMTDRSKMMLYGSWMLSAMA